jgi:hypothetical protein
MSSRPCGLSRVPRSERIPGVMWSSRREPMWLAVCLVLCATGAPTAADHRVPDAGAAAVHGPGQPVSSVAACARALSRSGGLLWRHTPEGEAEQELPAACGGGYERRCRTHDPCRDSCFVQNAAGELAVAARFREGNLLLVLGQAGRRFRPTSWLKLPKGEVQLLGPETADRVRQAMRSVHSASWSQPQLAAGEVVSFYVLGWRLDQDGWHGELDAAVRAGTALRLVPVMHASARDAKVPFKAASWTVDSAPPAGAVTEFEVGIPHGWVLPRPR